MIAAAGLSEKIGDSVGLQGAFGYLARTAASLGDWDRALVISEISLNLGKQAGDLFGQTITLELQVQVLLQQQCIVAAMGAALCHRDLSLAINDLVRAKTFESLLADVEKQVTPEDWASMVKQKEQFRLKAIAEAQQRLEAAGQDPLKLPDPK